MPRAKHFTLSTLLAAAAPAQQLELETVEILDANEAGVTAVEADGKAAVLVYGDYRVVLSRPVRHWAVGALSDGRWLIYAGGVASGLDAYLFDPRTGEVGLPFQTGDGLRLPASFGGGRGSWPRADPPHLFLFAVERGGRDCVFHAVDFSDQIPRELASLVLPLGVQGFEVSYDASTRLVRVDFDPGHGQVEFLHPLAPRLAIEPRAVEFGAVRAASTGTRSVSLSNAGRRPLPMLVAVEGTGFTTSRAGEHTIPPGRSVAIDIEFTPSSPEPVVGVLRIRSEVAGASVAIPLRGEALLATGPLEAGTPPSDEPRAADPEGGAPRPELPSLRELELTLVSLRRVDPESVLVEGEIVFDPLRFPRALWDSGRPHVVVENTTTGEIQATPASRSTVLSLRLGAAAGETVRMALADDRGLGPFAELACIGPTLELDGEDARVTAAPDSPFFLLEVETDDSGGRIERVLRSWSGRTDARGESEFALDSIPRGTMPMNLVVAEPARGRERLIYSRIVRY